MFPIASPLYYLERIDVTYKILRHISLFHQLKCSRGQYVEDLLGPLAELRCVQVNPGCLLCQWLTNRNQIKYCGV